MSANKMRLTGIICTVLAMLVLCSAALAAGTDFNANSKVTIKYTENGPVVPGAEFRIYRVADMKPGNAFIPTGDFKDYPINILNMGSSDWKELALTLKGYVNADKLQPLSKGKTDEKGTLELGEFKSGLYLVLGDSAEVDGIIYTPEPFFVTAPGKDEDGNWVNDIVVEPKYEMKAAPVPTCDITVVKVWDDKGNESKRPASVELQLMNGEEVYAIVTLSKDNNWRHTWKSLEAGDWSIVEKSVPENYNVKVICEGDTFSVTNTYTGSAAPGKPAGPKLPQTGTLWWIVPILAFAGIAVFTVGYVMEKKRG